MSNKSLDLIDLTIEDIPNNEIVSAVIENNDILERSDSFNNNPFDKVFKQVQVLNKFSNNVSQQTTTLAEQEPDDFINFSDSEAATFSTDILPSNNNQCSQQNNPSFNLSSSPLNDSAFCSSTCLIPSNAPSSNDISIKLNNGFIAEDTNIDCSKNETNFNSGTEVTPISFVADSSDGTSENCSRQNQVLNLFNLHADSPLKGSSDNATSSNQFMNIVESSNDPEDFYEDLMAINPNWVDSDTEQDNDLEMLKIPMLEKIEKEIANSTATIAVQEIEGEEKHFAGTETLRDKMFSLNLQALRDKVECKKIKDITHDIDELINSLRDKVKQCSDENQKTEADKLLKNLSGLVGTKSTEDNGHLHSQKSNITAEEGSSDIDNVHIKESNSDVPCNISIFVTEFIDNQESTTNEITNSSQEVIGVQRNACNPICKVRQSLAPTTPIRQKTQIIESNTKKSPEFAVQFRKRSRSLSLNDKCTKLQSQKDTQSLNILYSTPIRPGSPNRRSLFNSTPSKVNDTRRSIYNTSIHKSNNRRSTMKNIPNPICAAASGKKLKFKMSEPIRKNTGPIKAIVPIEKIAPLLTTPSISSNTNTEHKSKLLSSTPLSAFTPKKRYSDAYYTSNLVESPKSISRSKVRYSYIPTTPNLRQFPSASSSIFNKKRSSIDSKSPKKPIESIRENGIGKTAMKTLQLPQNFSTKPYTTGKWNLRRSYTPNAVKNKENTQSN